MEIRRFGIGHRRHEGPSGTHGVEATSVHVDERGVVAELALQPHAAIAPHSNPNLAYLLVIEGGGFVQVGDERARVAAGDAVVWPPNVVHAAWTELTPMRAIVVEFVEPPPGQPVDSPDQPPGESLRADGALAQKPVILPPDRDSPEGEPW